MLTEEKKNLSENRLEYGASDSADSEHSVSSWEKNDHPGRSWIIMIVSITLAFVLLGLWDSLLGGSHDSNSSSAVTASEDTSAPVGSDSTLSQEESHE